MYYVTCGDKVTFWGKLSECIQYLGDKIPERSINIVRREQLTMEQEQWLHKTRRQMYSSADQ